MLKQHVALVIYDKAKTPEPLDIRTCIRTHFVLWVPIALWPELFVGSPPPPPTGISLLSDERLKEFKKLRPELIQESEPKPTEP